MWNFVSIISPNNYFHVFLTVQLTLGWKWTILTHDRPYYRTLKITSFFRSMFDECAFTQIFGNICWNTAQEAYIKGILTEFATLCVRVWKLKRSAKNSSALENFLQFPFWKDNKSKKESYCLDSLLVAVREKRQSQDFLRSSSLATSKFRTTYNSKDNCKIRG